MALGKLWAGRVYGTNTGNLYIKLEGDDTALSGLLRLNETNFGIIVYRIQGKFKENRIELTGERENQGEGVAPEGLSIEAVVNPRGELSGEWQTTTGAAGALILYPHDTTQVIQTREKIPDQLHTARHFFGAVEIEREQIQSIAEEVQKDFHTGKVVVTFVAGTEQSRFFEDFKNLNISAERAESIKISVQEPEGAGIHRVVQIEFGPLTNIAMTQSGDEAWALGKLEKLKNEIRHFERSYATNVKRLGIGINQVLLVWALIYVPNLHTLLERTIFVGVILLLILIVNLLHRKYLPVAAIYLSQKPIGLLSRIGPTVKSWVIAMTAGVVTILLSAYIGELLGLSSK